MNRFYPKWTRAIGVAPLASKRIAESPQRTRWTHRPGRWVSPCDRGVHCGNSAPLSTLTLARCSTPFSLRRSRSSSRIEAGARSPRKTRFAAFDNGLALGADGLELDVHLSRDGIVVVHHDGMLERTTNLQGPVAERTAGELSRADAGFSFRDGGGFPFRGRGIGVPTLADVLRRVPRRSDHRGAQGRQRRAGARHGRSRPRRRRDRSRVSRRVRRPRPPRRACLRAGARHQRVRDPKCAGRSTDPGAGGRSRGSRTPATRSRNGRDARTSSRRASSRRRIAPALAFRSGRWTNQPTRGDCSDGAPTR